MRVNGGRFFVISGGSIRPNVRMRHPTGNPEWAGNKLELPWGAVTRELILRGRWDGNSNTTILLGVNPPKMLLSG